MGVKTQGRTRSARGAEQTRKASLSFCCFKAETLVGDDATGMSMFGRS